MRNYGIIEKPGVTAVIPVYNEEKCVGACIESLRAQTFSPLEIIVVDDGSSDSSAEICRGLGVRVLEQGHCGPGTARNLGAREASGDLLLFVDADMTFAPGYVSKLAEPVISGAAPGTSHFEELVSNWDNPWARAQTWFLGCPDRKRHGRCPDVESTVYRMVRKDFFLAAGGFCETEGRGDDSSLARRTGKMPLMVGGAVCYHSNIENIMDAFYDARWRGRDRASKIKSFSGFIAVAFVHHNPLRELAAGGRIFMRTHEPLIFLYAAVFGFGFQCGLFSAYLRGDYLK